MEKISKEGNLVDENSYLDQIKIKTWPVFLLGFLATAYLSLFNIAFVNNLIAHGLSATNIAKIGSIGMFMYILGPIIGNIIYRKIGIKRSIVVFCFIRVATTSVQTISTDFWVLLIIGIFFGISVGLFWPNISLQLSLWQNFTDSSTSSKNFRILSLSNSVGLILGYFIGIPLTLIWQNYYFPLILSVMIALIAIPISFQLQDDLLLNKFTAKNSTYQKRLKENKNEEKQNQLKNFPIIIPWIGILFLFSTQCIFGFTLPWLLKGIFTEIHPNNPNYFDENKHWVYIITFLYQILQTLAMYWINATKKNVKKNILIFSIIGSLFLSLSIMIFSNVLIPNGFLILLIIINIIQGIVNGFIQGICFKVVVDWGAITGKSHYNSFTEIVVALSWAIPPLIAGPLEDTGNIIYSFLYSIILGVIALSIASYLFFKTRQKKKNIN